MKEFSIKPMPTHIAKTDNKKVPNKYMKINNQAIYNGTLNYFNRAIVVNNLQNLVIDAIPKGFTVNTPFIPVFIIKTVYNHGSISRRKGKIYWKPPKSDYEPNWDIGNLAKLWIKIGEDAFTKARIIPDDNVKYIRGGFYKVEFVKDIKDLELIIKFMEV